MKHRFNAGLEGNVPITASDSSTCSQAAMAEGEAKELITGDLNESELHLHVI